MGAEEQINRDLKKQEEQEQVRARLGKQVRRKGKVHASHERRAGTQLTLRCGMWGTIMQPNNLCIKYR